ncbi:class I adenylate-forming enzyme family protein [Tumebacillus flagellatus]|uniref:Long-chain fatty acid--CoA ligase n=1 Tax=Tumebacillus flagellatus TaxID=1157490 RepID=A0A074LNH1_9BACL|nr:long-chain fatty acid--CoA ligase [Tumebacillus flagellatus]KEO82624.1 long-chain fatty acid--CoA ligase [Tumebacillus flagellatus]
MRRATDWLQSRARLTPQKLALVEVETGLRLTYQQFDARAARLGAYLQQHGVRKGDRVGFLALNSAGHLELLFACAKIGAVFVPLNHRFSKPELAYVLDDCKPAVLVSFEPFAELARELIAEVAIELHVEEPLYQQIAATEVGGGVPLPVELDEEDPWAIIYTGGTTGKSKGAILSHRAILWNSINSVLSWGLTEHDVTPVYMPMFHTGGLNALTTPVLHAGGTVVVSRDLSPAGILNVLEGEGCTIALLVPTVYHLLVTSPEFQAATFTTMHTFLSGGAPCPHTIYEAFWAKGLAFKEGYGLTEAGPNNFYIHPDRAKQKIGSVGVPMFHNEVRIVDNEGRDLPAGETGELWIQGPHVFSGYWNKPEVFAETLVDGWLRTGDLARRDADGCYYIVGRKKDMIITGGENVYPLEVEHILEQHPSISEVAVVGLPDPKWGEVVTAVVVLAPGAAANGELFKEYCGGKLAGYKIPKRWEFVRELPKTSVGKIDKKAIVHLHTQHETA